MMPVTKVDILEMVMSSLEFGDKLAEFCQRVDTADERLYPETTAAIKQIMVGLIALANATDVTDAVNSGPRDNGMN